jgi:hypothetical protein
MKLAVKSWFTGGIELPDSPSGRSEVHNVVDEDSGVEYASLENDIEADLWLAAMRTRIESGLLLPMSAAELRGADERLSVLEDNLASVGPENIREALRRWFPRQGDTRIGDEGLLDRLAALRGRVDEA